MISNDFMCILDAHSTWLNQGWKNTPLSQPALKHLNTRMASSPWWMPNTASNTCMKRNPKGLRMKQWSSWPLQIASLSTRQTWSESLVGMWQNFPPKSLALWMVWCHLCDCKMCFVCSDLWWFSNILWRKNCGSQVTEAELSELTREVRKINGVAPMIYTQSHVCSKLNCCSLMFWLWNKQL